MSKIRMNTEYRNKLYNRIKMSLKRGRKNVKVLEEEKTGNQQRALLNLEHCKFISKEDVATLRHFKKSMVTL